MRVTAGFLVTVMLSKPEPKLNILNELRNELESWIYYGQSCLTIGDMLWEMYYEVKSSLREQRRVYLGKPRWKGVPHT